jgi:hypothetical protein
MTKLNDRPLLETPKNEKSKAERLADRVLPTMKQAVRDAIADHHRAGNPVAVWHEGKVMLWYPDGTYRDVVEGAEESATAVPALDAPGQLSHPTPKV